MSRNENWDAIYHRIHNLRGSLQDVLGNSGYKVYVRVLEVFPEVPIMDRLGHALVNELREEELENE